MTNLLKLLKIGYARPGLIYGLYIPLENIPLIGNYKSNDGKYEK